MHASTPLAGPTYSSIVDHWETASSHLEESFSAYLKYTAALSTCIPENRWAATDLISRIDRKFSSLYTLLEEQLSHSRSTLARARNKLVPGFHAVPGEVWSQVFKLVVFERDESTPDESEHDVRAFYRRLYSLMGVCSFWHEIGISQGSLWSLVPMICRRSGWLMKQQAAISLQRAQGRDLHLMASIEARHRPVFFVDAMERHAGRIRTINLIADEHQWFHVILSPLIKLAPPTSLTELFLLYAPPDFEKPRLLDPEIDDYEYITSSNPSRPGAINPLFPALRVLRVCGVHIHWKSVTLTQLVELHIESVMLGFNSDLYQFILVLASAPQLNKLRISSLITYSTPDDTEGPVISPLSFPNLRLLDIEDLYSDALQLVLSSIIPGSYTTTVYATDKSVQTNTPEEIVWGGVDDLIWAVRGAKIETLMLKGDSFDGSWIDGDSLRILLAAVPSLSCLKINDWDFLEGDWIALCRPPAMGDTPSLPQLQHVEITEGQFHNTKSIKKFVTSHSVQRMVLGGRVALGPGWCEVSEREPLTRSDPVVGWLEATVPNFELVAKDYMPPEFRLERWPLC